MIRFGIAELYCGASGKTGYYNSQEIGLARAMKKLGYRCYIFYPAPDAAAVTEEDVEEHITIVRCPARAIGVHARYDWKILKKYRIDVVQLGGDNQIFAPDFIRYCDKNGIPVYNFIGTVGTDSHNAVKKRLMGKTPPYLQPCMAEKFGYKRGAFPLTEAVCDSIVSLPI